MLAAGRFCFRASEKEAVVLGDFSVSFRSAAVQLFGAAQRLYDASENLLSVGETEKLVAEVEDAVYRCRRVLNSAQYLEKTNAAS